MKIPESQKTDEKKESLWEERGIVNKMLPVTQFLLSFRLISRKPFKTKLPQGVKLSHRMTQHANLFFDTIEFPVSSGWNACVSYMINDLYFF